MVEGLFTLGPMLLIVAAIVFIKVRAARRENREVGGGPMATGNAEPVPYTLERLGLKHVVRDASGRVVRGGCGEIDGVMVESRREIGGPDGESVRYDTTIALAPLAPAVTLKSGRRGSDAIVLGDADFDKTFHLTGSLAAAVLHLDQAARAALVAAVRDGEWKFEGERMTHHEHLHGRELPAVLPLGVRAINALRVGPAGPAARLAKTVAHDPSVRMRRRAMWRLARDHATSGEVLTASASDDRMIGVLGSVTTEAPDAWLLRAREVALGGVGVLELAEALTELKRPESLPLVGELLAHPVAGDDETRRALEVARTTLRALVQSGAGGLALSEHDHGGLAIVEPEQAH